MQLQLMPVHLKLGLDLVSELLFLATRNEWRGYKNYGYHGMAWGIETMDIMDPTPELDIWMYAAIRPCMSSEAATRLD